MAEELLDGEFWLPSKFLDDDEDNDIFRSGFVSCSSSEPETSGDNNDDNLPHKLLFLSTSPNSTLLGFQCSRQGSNLGNPTTTYANATLDLMNEVGTINKIESERRSGTGTGTGTGFFDCTKTLLCPPQRNPAHFHPSSYSHRHRLPSFPPVQKQNRVTNNNKNSSNCPLGLPTTAWPSLTPQAQAQPQSITALSVPPNRESVGTGVFLPRCVPPLPCRKNKSAGVNTTKKKKRNNKEGSQRQNSGQPKLMHDEMRLPSEWTY